MMGGAVSVLTALAGVVVWQGGFPSRLNDRARQIFEFARSHQPPAVTCHQLAAIRAPRKATVSQCGPAEATPRYLLAGILTPGCCRPR